MQEMNSNLIHEWEVISRRTESIDARIWQGAGILLIMSIGGISLLRWDLPNTITDLVLIIAVGIASVAILSVWWYIFHRWIHLQSIYNYRAREIEKELNIRFNIYARLMQHWEDPEAEIAGKSELKGKDPEGYERLQIFWAKQKKKRFAHTTIRSSLRWLTIILATIWILFIALHIIAFLSPRILEL